MRIWLLLPLLVLGSACTEVTVPGDTTDEHGHHGGRVLVDGGFSLELTIFDAGVEPEYRAWIERNGEVVSPETVDLRVTLERLGGRKDVIEFDVAGEFLRGRSVVAEPHSFIATVVARHEGSEHRWRYDQFEGRTRITDDMARSFGIETDRVSPATIRETISTRGRVAINPEMRHAVTARFDGIVRSVGVGVGDSVQAGQILAEVESDDSLNRYALTAPSAGVIVARDANPGEHSAGRVLFQIVDTSSVWVELAVFPGDRGRIATGLQVVIRSVEGIELGRGEVDWINLLAETDQTVTARVVLENPDGRLLPGAWVTGEITVDDHPVERAIRTSALQSFRHFTVAFERVGEDYEVRMLELGRRDDEWVEVLGGIRVGAEYVVANSYLIKADIEKSSAGHEH